MSLSTVLETLFDISVEAKKFYLFITKEMEYQKENCRVDFPYDKYVFVCASILKGMLEDESYKVDLVHDKEECNMTISCKNAEDTPVKDIEDIEVADHLALEGDFISAIKMYEMIRENGSLDPSIVQSDSGEDPMHMKIMFKIVLCAVATDNMILYKNKLDIARKYNWKNGEIGFLENLVQHVINYDIKSFTETIRKFDGISSLDTWTTTMLLKIKNHIR
jgi:hypothetical protein